MAADESEVLHRILAERGQFGHREHLELAWAYLSMYTLSRAERAMAGAIRQVAARHGAPDLYHDTLTRSWVRLVAVHMRASAACTFERFIADNPELLERTLLDRHYSGDVLTSDAARREWVAPDLAALPAHV